MLTRLLILGLGDTAIGLALVTGAPSRTSSPAYTEIKHRAPIDVWGGTLLTIGLLLLLGLVLHARVTPRLTRLVEAVLGTVGAMWCAFWATALTATALEDERVGYTGGALWLFFGVVPHLALAFGREG